MTLDEYQYHASRTRNLGQEPKWEIANYGFSFAEELGEGLGVLKKHIFHNHPLDRDKIREELGDWLWYLTAIAAALGMDLEDIAQENILKLQRRYPEGYSDQRSMEREDHKNVRMVTTQLEASESG